MADSATTGRSLPPTLTQWTRHSPQLQQTDLSLWPNFPPVWIHRLRTRPRWRSSGGSHIEPSAARRDLSKAPPTKSVTRQSSSNTGKGCHIKLQSRPPKYQHIRSLHQSVRRSTNHPTGKLWGMSAGCKLIRVLGERKQALDLSLAFPRLQTNHNRDSDYWENDSLPRRVRAAEARDPDHE